MNNLYGKEGYDDITANLKIKLQNIRSELNEGDENYPHIQAIIDANGDK